MITIRKTKQFEKLESKYLKKLTPKQIELYKDNLEKFHNWTNDDHYLLNTHPLKWKWLWYDSFTCLKNAWRDDRIIFKIIDWDRNNYESVELVDFELVWDHKIYDM